MPLLFLGPVAGVFADRWPRLRIMISTNVACAGAVSLLMLATRPGQLWLVLLAVIAENCSAGSSGRRTRAWCPRSWAAGVSWRRLMPGRPQPGEPSG